MTVLVSGGSGLVGSHVIAALVAGGTPVRALVRPASRSVVAALGAEPVTGDVTDPAAWARAAAGVSGIVHAAAYVAQRGTREDFFAVNVGGTRCAAAAARDAGARLVHVSSVAVYGRTGAYAAGAGGVTEDFPFGAIWAHDYYAQSKRAAEDALWEAAARDAIPAVAIRPNVVYGERDRLFSPRVVRAIRGGFVPQVGAGTNRLSCVYAGNVAAAVGLALTSRAAPGRAYNTTDDGPDALTQRAFVDAFADALGVRVRRITLPYAVARVAVDWWARWQMLRRPGAYPGVGGAAVRFLAGENPYRADRARRELGWRPVGAPRDAVARTVRWILENEKPGR
ncbi:MAG TPA: NAD-dependent epimerase/dehydratase family protein [Gemmatimonadales bacterium]